ncbi:MAG: adenylate/guanylate cyclase domain-containing protein [Spirochaetaceae bacterium]|jgi:class 3 adenylate cyclase|nr:adenylate/guanylate cyclase domain-containing protein [Spirochaetaceae bacterium]
MPSLKHQLLAAHDAMQNFADWRFDGEIPIERRDESGVLAFTLNRLAQFYGQIAPLSNKTFAGRIQTGKMPPINQNNKAVVLFCNMRSFSSVTRGLRPREKLDLANTFFQKAGLCARLTGGYVDTYLGDKMIVHWGILNGGGPRENALAAIRAVLMTRACLGDWNRKRIGAGLEPLFFSFGLDAGRASLSPFSVDGILEYRLTGPTVNNACRYEAATKKTRTETLLSENVYRLVERFVVSGEMPRVPAKPRLFTLINLRGKRHTRLLANDLAHIVDIDLPFAMTLAGPRGPRTLSELRTMLYMATP